eukprot:m.260271 g.260271  ORF g.260271 m.260271 type:complete len:61 (-) comp17590_c0_seq2:977-1159(-)
MGLSSRAAVNPIIDALLCLTVAAPSGNKVLWSVPDGVVSSAIVTRFGSRGSWQSSYEGVA